MYLNYFIKFLLFIYDLVPIFIGTIICIGIVLLVDTLNKQVGDNDEDNDTSGYF